MVDDAIVVVENVERVMEEDPARRPAEATKKAMAEITGADHRDHPRAAVGVRAGRPSFPGIIGRAVPAVRGHASRVAMFSASRQRADSVARRCARVLLEAESRPAARHHVRRVLNADRLGARRLRRRRRRLRRAIRL
ncbi:MAG: efflux RND transporter permease subunit [Rhodopseudomonas palustris]|nr:efflux RND transporter permease subunit [Rhodopseudomonas palustris]